LAISGTCRWAVTPRTFERPTMCSTAWTHSV
jgi:hypothetical protein